MASEYDALLDAPPTQQRSEYDALLTPTPQTQETSLPQPSRIPSAYIPPDVEKQVTEGFDVQHPILGAAAQALGETVSGFVPRTVQQAEQLATPMAGAFEDIGKAAGSLTDAIFGGKTLTQAAEENYPESLALKEAEQTAPYSKERFRAGFDTVAQMLMGAGIAHGLTPKPNLTESIFGKAPEAPSLIPETPVTDAATLSTQEQPAGLEALQPKETTNASQITSPESVPIPTLRQEVGGEAPLRQQGETPAARQETQPTTPQEVAPQPSAAELANPSHDLNKIRRPLGPNGEELPNGEQVGAVTMPEGVEPWQMSFNDYANAENIDRRVAASLYRDSINTAVSLGKLSGEQAVEKLGGSTPSLENNIRLRKSDEAQWGHEPAPTHVEEVKPSPQIPKGGEGLPQVGRPKEVAAVPQPGQPVEAGETPPISTKNEYTEQQRAIRGMPEAEQAARRSFGTVWDEAAAQAEKDPTIGQRLVDELNAKPRPISDVENAHLLRREIEAQKEHSDSVDAVNNSKTPEDLTAAKARLELARTDLQNVYDATKSAGTKGGQALAARKMLANEDYSLAKMEARRRAANDGKPLTENQLAETKALHDKIADLQSKLDAHEVAATFEKEFSKLVEESRKEARQAKSTGTRFTDFLDRKADEARARITERRGRLTTGFDPQSITDEAVIGASHIARGLTKFADWSVKMVDELGEQIRPFLKDLWERARAFHDANAKEYGDKALARYKTYLGKQTEQIKAKLEAGDFTKAQRQKTQLDKEAFEMRANLQKLKNEFERGVAKEAYKNKTPAQKFWDHFVGVERAMKLSGPEVFGKLGTAAAVREALAPIESAGGYGVSKVFPKLATGTKYGADLGTVVRGELKAKAALFTQGMKDAWQNVKGRETGLEAIGGGKIRPDFWYNRIGQMHAAIKAPVKRAEFVRSLESRMASAIKNGEDINHPEVMTRLANESVMDANRAIFQNKTVVSSFFSMLDRQIPVAGRTARFLFPVVKIPVNIFKELVDLHVGAPVGAARVGMAYWKGVETLPALQREAIIRQLVKGSIGGAGLLWGYYNRDKVRNFFDHAPTWFQHTPMAMILNEGSYLKGIEAGGQEAKQSSKELAYMAKTDIPFMYTIKDIGDALDAHNSHAFLGWINNMTQSTVVPQVLTQTAKQMDKPGTFPSNLGERPRYRPAANPIQAVEAGIPGLRERVPEKGPRVAKGRKNQQVETITQ